MSDLTLADVPLMAGIVALLVLVEGLLSADNALVLAVMVKHLPADQQKRALRYGIWGAFGFRLVMLLGARYLIKFWVIKFIAGLYLIAITVYHFASGTGREGRGPGSGRGFWLTVAAVEGADLAFSIDSILAAVVMAESLPKRLSRDWGIPFVEMNWRFVVIYVGGILGIVTMRFVAVYFIKLLQRFPGLESGAYILVAWIGVKLVGSAVHVASRSPTELPEWLFWGGMAVILLASAFFSRGAGDDKNIVIDR